MVIGLVNVETWPYADGPCTCTSGAPTCSEIPSTFAWGRKAPSIHSVPRGGRTTPALSVEQMSDDMFNVLQHTDNGVGNTLTELGIVLERNKVKVAVIQEAKSKNPCIRNYTTMRKDRPHGHGGRLLIFIDRSITFSKQPSSPESLSDLHLEELTIKADIWNTKLIISTCTSLQPTLSVMGINLL